MHTHMYTNIHAHNSLVERTYVKYMYVHVQMTTCACTSVQVTAALMVIFTLGIVMFFALGPSKQLMNNSGVTP